ncbi:MAG TPA: glycosyl hydrolase family 28-related protein, partial [Pyrinomonadaceae bacterium]|nr:glycosyl hydrolase family 28-related protein [Pyrinomonadaceae bacterium]
MVNRRSYQLTSLFLCLSLACCLFDGVTASAQRTTRSRTNNQPSTAKPAPTFGFNVRAFGATGDGKTLDTPAINKTIDAAAAGGGGTVFFPAGSYLSVTIRLKSNVALYLDQGATIVAATPGPGMQYDAPEPNPWDPYQDFGHSHWRNSLIWGENLENIAILGPG